MYFTHPNWLMSSAHAVYCTQELARVKCIMYLAHALTRWVKSIHQVSIFIGSIIGSFNLGNFKRVSFQWFQILRFQFQKITIFWRKGFHFQLPILEVSILTISTFESFNFEISNNGKFNFWKTYDSRSLNIWKFQFWKFQHTKVSILKVSTFDTSKSQTWTFKCGKFTFQKVTIFRQFQSPMFQILKVWILGISTFESSGI